MPIRIVIEITFHTQLASMKDLARSARASIRQIQDKIRRKAICLWVVIITLFLLNVAVVLTLIQNHGRLLVYDD